MKKILVKGPALTQSGYGEHARFLLRTLKTAENIFDIYFININWGQTSWTSDDSDERRWLDSLIFKTIKHIEAGGNFDISLQVTIPQEWEKLAPINIGVTAGIETTKISPGWVEKSLMVDKIIVVSEHTKYGFENTKYPARDNRTGEEIIVGCSCPIDVVGFPVKDIKPKKTKLKLKDEFNFLIVGTWIPRKNMQNTIRWFVEEFKEQEVGLVIKTSLAKNSKRDRMIAEKRLNALLAPYGERKCNVYLLHGDMTEEELHGVYKHSKIKALVNIAHGEGFGLPIFEAAYCGLPVVSINWGGQADFMNMPVKDKKGKVSNKPMFTTVSYDIKPVEPHTVWEGVIQPDSQWAYAREWDYKKALRTTVKNYKSVQSQARKLKKYVNDTFSETNQIKKFITAIGGDAIEKYEEEVDKLLEDLL